MVGRKTNLRKKTGVNTLLVPDGATMLDYYAGCALAGYSEYFSGTYEFYNVPVDQIADDCFDLAVAMMRRRSKILGELFVEPKKTYTEGEDDDDDD